MSVDPVLACREGFERPKRTGLDGGLLYHGPDIPAELAHWKVWPPAPVDLLPAGWNHPPSNRDAELSLDIAAVRLLARSLAEAAEDIETCRLRLGAGLEYVEIESPGFLCSLVSAARTLSEEIRRRADGMEEADQQAATAAQAIATSFARLGGPLAGMFQGWADLAAAPRKVDPIAEHRAIADDPHAPLAERYEANRWLIRDEIARGDRREDQAFPVVG